MTSDRYRRFLLEALLAGAVLAVYFQVYSHGFVEYDDPAYVSENLVVRRGLTVEGVRWAFTTGYMGHWNPLTWLSHMLDVQIFGVEPGAHHLVNVALHIANAILLFSALRRMTAATWPSFIVAALFALHPLRVESVAWISERKDVLSTFFWFLVLWTYARYVEAESRAWYGAMVAFFALGLMAKPMLVTVPFVLLLLDLWPLGRGFSFVADGAWLQGRTSQAGRRKSASARPQRTANSESASRLVAEKLPLFALAVVFSVVAYATQSGSGAVAASDALPLFPRVANALVSYVRYLGMAVWPAHLAVLYPYVPHLPIWQPAAAAVFLGLISALALRLAAGHPYLLVGWFWYLGTLVPVIGLVQIGNQALADRYTYVPLVGVFLIAVWGGRHLVARARVPATAVAVAAALIIAAYGVAAREQVKIWKSGESLLSHTARVTDSNSIAHNNLGVALGAQGRVEEALEQHQMALRINPNYDDAHNNLGSALRETGRIGEAIEHYEEALRLNPSHIEAHYNLGIALVEKGRLQDAIAQYREALRLMPDHYRAHNNLGNALADSGRFSEAIEHYRAALRIVPDFVDAHYNLGIALAQSGRLEEAIEQYQEAIRLRPDHAEAHNNLGVALVGADRLPEAIERYRQALRLKPDYPVARLNLGIALTKAGEANEAIEQLREALRRKPENPEVHYQLGLALMAATRPAEAILHFEQALALHPDYPEAHNDLGVALVDTSRVDDAIGHFREALRLDPELPDAQYNLEVALGMQRSTSNSNHDGAKVPAPDPATK